LLKETTLSSVKTAALDALFNPRSVAIIGASAVAGKQGAAALRYLRQGGFSGAIYPVHPAGGESDGLTCYARVSDIPGPVDCVLTVIPAAATLEALRECAAKGVRAAIIGANGFADLNTPEGRSRLVHEAKPLLTRIAAPALQIQLGHQLAEQAQMATQELARITGLRLSAERNFGRSFGRGDARRGAPPPARRGLEAKLERRLLRGLVAQPDRASALTGLMNANTQEPGSPAGRAITALTQQVLQQPGMSASFLLDVFQGSEHEKPIADAYAELLELRMDDAQLEADFQSDLAAMRSALKTARIEQLKSIASEAMSAEEKIELVRLISEQAQRRYSSA
jgi:predicted CoA-binding protein